MLLQETGETGEGDFSCVAATWAAIPSASAGRPVLSDSVVQLEPPARGRPLHVGGERQQLNAQLLRRAGLEREEGPFGS